MIVCATHSTNSYMSKIRHRQYSILSEREYLFQLSEVFELRRGIEFDYLKILLLNLQKQLFIDSY